MERRLPGLRIDGTPGFAIPFEVPVVDDRDVLVVVLVVGGSIDGRPDILVRFLTAADTLDVVGGGAVRELELLEAGPVSCFVGDFVGDYSALGIPYLKPKGVQQLTPVAREATEALVLGVGLSLLILCLFAVGSITLCLLAAPRLLLTLDGRDFAATPFAGPVVFLAGLGADCSMTEATAGLMNMP